MSNNYQNQAVANMDVFLEYKDYAMKKEILEKVVHLFEEYDIKWELSCSANLFFRGIVDTFNDFDIIIARESCNKIQKVMESLNARTLEKGDQSCFNSTFFNRYVVKSVGLDIISEWRVVTFGTSYCYEYSEQELDFIEIGDCNLKVPLIPMEAQFLLYSMMEGWQPQRLYKRTISEKYLKDTGIKYPEILRRASSNDCIPIWLKKLVREIII